MANVASSLGCFEGLDDADANLIIELQLADIATMQSQLKGKGFEGEYTDAERVLLLFCQNLQDNLSILSDRRMAQSIALAVQNDGPLVVAATLEEDQEDADHAIAHRLAGNEVKSNIRSQGQKLDDQVLSKLAGIYLSESAGCEILDLCNHEKDSGGEPSSRQGSTEYDDRRLTRRCEACRDFKKYFDVIAGPCQHEYCRDCLHELFEASLTDESLFPPRCCRQPITIDSVDIFLTKDLKTRFEEKKIEFSTPDRTYCCNATCSSFIRLDQVHGDAGTCAACGVTTCVICKSAGHAGECPNDTALQAVVDLANEQHWQRCFSCRRVVELDVGCNHITQVSPTLFPESSLINTSQLSL